jgi:hypothetical protein
MSPLRLVSDNTAKIARQKKASMPTTKTVCQRCGDGYSDEANMLGRCCGLPLIDVALTQADIDEHHARSRAIAEIIKSNDKLNW